MTTLLVIYPARDGATFDRDYYVGKHLPLAHEIWGPLGLSKSTPMFAGEGDATFEALVLLDFPDRATLDAALANPGSARVVGDVPNFTNIIPQRQILEPG